MNPSAQSIVDWYSSLNQDSLKHISNFYTEDAFFKDPFNEVRGTAAIKLIFEHMFRTTENPRFEFKDVITQDHQVFLSWIFRFRLNHHDYEVLGASHLQLDTNGKISMHRDYWDPAEELWQKLPFLGGIIRWLRSKFRAL